MLVIFLVKTNDYACLMKPCAFNYRSLSESITTLYMFIHADYESIIKN